MRSVGARCALAVGALAAVFCGAVVCHAWFFTKRQAEQQAALQADLAMELNHALRACMAEATGPEVAKRNPPDDPAAETACPSSLVRKVFEDLRKSFPDYVVRFPSEDPHSPDNRAGGDEVRLLRYFRENPEKVDWGGPFWMAGGQYVARARAVRIEQSCLRCHGRPEDAPKSLLARYGSTGGFNRKVGDLAGMDLVAIPMQKIDASLRVDITTQIVAAAAWLIVLFGAVFVAFRLLVARRLTAIAEHFRDAAVQPEDAPIAPVPDQGNDEIGVLARSFNALAARLRGLHASLEERVQQRTAELSREQQTLKHLLQSGDRERQLIAYEIHDSLAQQLAAALMQFQAHDRLREQDPEAAARAFEDGIRMVRQCLLQSRRLISGVRPPILDESGVVAAIAHLVQERLASHEGVQIEFHRDVEFGRLTPVVENAIYRVVHEGLTNALAHSQSKKIRIELVQVDQRVQVAVQDWGAGFHSEDVTGRGFGLESIRERVRVLGGTATVESTPGEGTRIVVTLPIVASETQP